MLGIQLLKVKNTVKCVNNISYKIQIPETNVKNIV